MNKSFTPSRRVTAIVAPPPTPNGDLHVGHVAGPYFGADVFQRYMKLRGNNPVSALSVDLNQSYVVTTAERLQIEPMSLAQKSHKEVSETLELAEIRFDKVGMPDGEYSSHIRAWFTELFEAGALTFRKRQVPFDTTNERFLFESYASGWCPTCLAGTNANICEACGHPNDASDLLGLHATGGNKSGTIEYREVTEYVLSLEDYREELLEHLSQAIQEKRPALNRLLSELFERPLPDFPITFPSAWGIPAPFPSGEGLVLNVWAEMVPGHYYWLEQADPETSIGKIEEYVQFLGFDNSFFYVVAHLALALSAKRHGMKALLPTTFITNEFYLMENFKFSTSQGHLIWARDLISDVCLQELRFYLAWSNPEYNQSNFTRDDFTAVVEKKLRKPLAEVHRQLGRMNVSAQESNYSVSLRNRFDSAYRPSSFSLRIAAQAISNGLSLAVEMNDEQVTQDKIVGFCQVLAAGMAPIMPKEAQRLWEATGGNVDVCWGPVA